MLFVTGGWSLASGGKWFELYDHGGCSDSRVGVVPPRWGLARCRKEPPASMCWFAQWPLSVPDWWQCRAEPDRRPPPSPPALHRHRPAGAPGTCRSAGEEVSNPGAEPDSTLLIPGVVGACRNLPIIKFGYISRPVRLSRRPSQLTPVPVVSRVGLQSSVARRPTVVSCPSAHTRQLPVGPQSSAARRPAVFSGPRQL